MIISRSARETGEEKVVTEMAELLFSLPLSLCMPVDPRIGPFPKQLRKPVGDNADCVMSVVSGQAALSVEHR